MKGEKFANVWDALENNPAEANEGICAFVEKRDPKWPE
jgi:hypothetical protein